MNTNDYLLCEDSNKYYKFIILIIRLIGIRITDIARIRSLVILLEKLELLRGSRRARHECPPNAGRRRIKRPSAGVAICPRRATISITGSDRRQNSEMSSRNYWHTQRVCGWIYQRPGGALISFALFRVNSGG